MYFVTAFIAGISLAELIERQPGGSGLPVAEAMSLLRQTAGAIDFAHRSGAIHRDVKPANIMVKMTETPRTAFLVDFGITKMGDGDPSTPVGEFVGTPDYAAPEQVAGEALDERADVYSFACTAFDVLTGRPPFADAPDDEARLTAQRRTALPSISKLRPELSAGVDAVFAKATAKVRDERYATCTEFVDALRAELPEAALEYRRPVPLGTAGTVASLGGPRHRAAAPLALARRRRGVGAGGRRGGMGAHRRDPPPRDRRLDRAQRDDPHHHDHDHHHDDDDQHDHHHDDDDHDDGPAAAQPVRRRGGQAGRAARAAGARRATSRLALQARSFDPPTASPGSPAAYYAEWARIMGPATPSDPVIATDDGYAVTADKAVEVQDFRLDVNKLVTTFTECTDRCRPLDSADGLNFDVCPDGDTACTLVTSESGRFTATKVMDVVLRQPAASALFRIELDDPALVVTAINDTSGSAHFVPQGQYFVMAFAGTPAVGTEEILTIRYSDGTTDHLRLTF